MMMNWSSQTKYIVHTESLEASWPEAVVEAVDAATPVTSTLFFLKALFPPAEPVPRPDVFLDLMDLT